MMKTNPVKWLTASLVGLLLLIPASYFMLALFVRIVFGSTGLYYAIAPAFLQASSQIFSFHESAWILYGPCFAIILNMPFLFQFHLQRNDMKLKLNVFYRNHWLNTAVILQSLLLFIIVVIYLGIEHYRF